MSLSPSAFVAKWQGSAGDERANKDSFLREFCEALALDTPGPKDGSPDYCFEKDIRLTHGPQAEDPMTNTKMKIPAKRTLPTVAEAEAMAPGIARWAVSHAGPDVPAMVKRGRPAKGAAVERTEIQSFRVQPTVMKAVAAKEKAAGITTSAAIQLAVLEWSKR